MRISARSDYAVRAALGLATAYPSLLSTQVIAPERAMPREFLETVLADLCRAGMFRAQRGTEGGYPPARPPRAVTGDTILPAVKGPLTGVRGLRPEQTRYEGVAEHLPRLRVAVGQVHGGVSLAAITSGRLPARVRRLTALPDAWEPR